MQNMRERDLLGPSCKRQFSIGLLQNTPCKNPKDTYINPSYLETQMPFSPWIPSLFQCRNTYLHF